MEAKIEKLTAEVAKVKKQKRASAKLAAESMEKANAMMASIAEEGAQVVQSYAKQESIKLIFLLSCAVTYRW